MITFKQRVIFAAHMFAAAVLSLLLLAYVGQAETKRSYLRFEIMKLIAEAEIVQGAIEKYLRSSLPLNQFIGFNPISDRVILADRSIFGLSVLDHQGRQIFGNGQLEVPDRSHQPFSNDVRHQAWLTKDSLLVELPLRDKFEIVGHLQISMRLVDVVRYLDGVLSLFISFAIAISGLFAGFAFHYSAVNQRLRTFRIRLLLIIAFIMMSVLILTIMWPIYLNGAQIRTKALSETIASRVGAILESGIAFEDISGLDKAFAEYRRMNPDMVAIGLLANDIILIHSDPQRVGGPWISDDGAIENYCHLPAVGDIRYKIVVSVSKTAIYSVLLKNARNLAAIFLAVALISALLHGISNSLLEQGVTPPDQRSFGLEMVKIILFFVVFIDNLSVSFLPQIIRETTTAAGLPEFFSSLIFMLYFLFFAVSLLPAEKLVMRWGARPLITIGALLIAGGTLFLTLSENLLALSMARALCGTGQGLLFIGIQSFIIAASTEENRTRANGIIVFSFNAGMIAGMSLGSLFVLYLGEWGVFVLGVIISLGTAAYALIWLPVMDQVSADTRPPRTANNFGLAFRDLEFIKALLLVGIPNKAVMTGVIIFALPLLLADLDYGPEEIGQIIMFYAAGVLVTNSLIGEFVDRAQNTQFILFVGMCLGALGLLLIGACGMVSHAWMESHPVLLGVGLLLGVGIVGIAHGAINAPVLTMVIRTRFATITRSAKAVALYRFAERGGHIAGPLLLGQLMQLGGNNLSIVAWVGGIMLFFALLLYGLPPAASVPEGHQES